MKEGKLIVLAGGEGCGKSTCLEYLKETLSKEFFIFTREPGGTPCAEKIRDFFLNNELSAYEELLAVELARSIHFREKVLPALRSGKHVISDRCCEATWAYQVIAKKTKDHLGNIFALLDKHSRGGKDIDLWIDFKIDVEKALLRRMNDVSEINIFDSRPLEYHIKVREGLDQFFKHHKKNVLEINGEHPPLILATNVCKAIRSFCL